MLILFFTEGDFKSQTLNPLLTTDFQIQAQPLSPPYYNFFLFFKKKCVLFYFCRLKTIAAARPPAYANNLQVAGTLKNNKRTVVRSI
jgi:hypothetical protein